MSYVPEQGDIVWLSFDPSSSIEIIKRRPAYVISIKLEVVLEDGLATKGTILVHQVKSLDFVEREATFIERVSLATSAQVRTLLKVIMD